MSTTPGEGARFGRTLRESNVPAADAAKERVDGPNVVMVVLDDLGFAQLGCFGRTSRRRTSTGSPRRAALHQFHVTALCSPTRASC